MRIEYTTLSASSDTGALVVYGGVGIGRGINMGSTDTAVTTGTLQINGGGGIIFPTIGGEATMMNYFESKDVTVPFSGGDLSTNATLYLSVIGNRIAPLKIIYFVFSSVTIGSTNSTIIGSLEAQYATTFGVRKVIIYTDTTSGITAIGSLQIVGTAVTIGSDVSGGQFIGTHKIQIRPFSVEYKN